MKIFTISQKYPQIQKQTNRSSDPDIIYRSQTVLLNATAQLGFTYSKLTIETLEQGAKYVQS